MVSRGYKKKTKEELLDAIDNCVSISQIFALVQHEQIDIRMQTMCSASNLPPKSPNIPQNPSDSPLEKLKSAVKLAVINN